MEQRKKSKKEELREKHKDMLNKNLKYCPLYVGFEEREGVIRGSGMMRSPVRCKCMREDCAAYANGRCRYFKTVVDLDVAQQSEQKENEFKAQEISNHINQKIKQGEMENDK